LELSRDPHFGDLRERLSILVEVGAALADVGEYAQAIPYLQEAEGLADGMRAATQHSLAIRLQMQCWFGMDRWDEMLKLEEGSRLLAQKHGAQQVGSPCFEMALSASIRAWRGEIGLAKSLREQSYGIMTSDGSPPDRWDRQRHY
jgi:hypothetical protein